MTGAGDLFRRTGTMREAPPARLLTAGALTAEFSGGALQSLRYQGMEILRAISFLVRDRDWGTYDPDIEDLKLDQGPDGFTVSYRARCRGPHGQHLSIQADIAAAQSGAGTHRLTFTGRADSATGFETNRCGFCILHPIVGLAGTSVAVEHVDGSVETTVLPDLIEPWQPFKDMRAIRHKACSGVEVECRMEGDTFEMEDQRNWSDASYKTYVRPLALPWPYTIPPGEAVVQVITLTVRDDRRAHSGASHTVDAPVRLLPQHRTDRTIHLPRIGLVVTPEEAEATRALLGSACDPGVQDLLFHFDPIAGHDDRAIASFSGVAARHGGSTTLEIALPCRSDLADELQAIAEAARRSGFRPDLVVVSPAVDRQSTPPGSPWPACPPLSDIYAAARMAFPDARLGGGMLSYFTELNRKRVPADTLDVVTHCTSPIVHSADDRSVMQTLEALPFVTRSVRHIYGDIAYRIGPSTIAMRQNPYGSRTMDNPDQPGGARRIAMAHRDPRHNALFGAAYALGYAIVTAPTGLQQLTLSALTGPFGLVAGENEPMPVGQPRPLFHVVALLAELAGARMTACVSDRPDALVGMIATKESRRTVLMVNITPQTVSVDVSALQIDRDDNRLYRLDAETMVDAVDGGWRASITRERLTSGSLAIGPYGMARIEG